MAIKSLLKIEQVTALKSCKFPKSVLISDEEVYLNGTGEVRRENNLLEESSKKFNESHSDSHKNCSKLWERRSRYSRHRRTKNCQTGSNKANLFAVSAEVTTIRIMKSSAVAIGVSYKSYYSGSRVQGRPWPSQEAFSRSSNGKFLEDLCMDCRGGALTAKGAAAPALRIIKVIRILGTFQVRENNIASL
ncbi:hypothetical protein TNCV_2294281 [Trichonephila clavipes]|nr:hypothetical protein TNCV_2294281 [Trichonephila clavipes]